VYVNQPTGNPNPHNFIIEEVMAIGKFVIARVRYPDCSNYEGRKVLVFEGTTTRTLQTQVALDPHFCDSKVHPSPVARFEPTNRGWNYAISFCQSA
jgi:uracil DNA glycosylase